MLPNDWFGQPPLGEMKIDTNKFRSLTSLNDGGDAVINGSFFRRFNIVLDQHHLSKWYLNYLGKIFLILFF